MGKLLSFPGVDINPPSRSELVDQISEMMLKEVTNVFIEQRYEPGRLCDWHRHIRDYFWHREILLEDRQFRVQDVKAWRHFWRGEAMRYIASKRIR